MCREVSARCGLVSEHVDRNLVVPPSGGASRSNQAQQPGVIRWSYQVPLTFHDAIIPSNLQILRAVKTLVDKAAAFGEENGIAEVDVIDTRLVADMLPFGYQVLSCADNSAGAIRGVEAGVFAPKITTWPTTYAGLHRVIDAAIADLEAVDAEAFDALVDVETWFVAGETRIPFTGASFLFSFAQPNFYFHAATAYDILRAQGATVGKSDFMGVMRSRR